MRGGEGEGRGVRRCHVSQICFRRQFEKVSSCLLPASAQRAMPSIAELFPDCTCKVRRDRIRDQYAIDPKTVGGEHVLPFLMDKNGCPDVNQPKITRHPLNDRTYHELEKNYCDRMLKDGYDNDDAGAISLQATDGSRRTWLAIGGATRCKAFERAYAKEADNVQLVAFIREGGFKATFYTEAMPEEVVVWLVEELNVRTCLGVTNTLMQKILNVQRYQDSFSTGRPLKDQVASGSSEFVEDQWKHISALTPVYSSQIEWKKAQVLFGNLSSHFCHDDDGIRVRLIDDMKSHYERCVDPLGMQSHERNRNMIKYLNDVLARILPSRFAAGKGKCIKYPELAREAIKLSLLSHDIRFPFVIMADGSLDRLNDTFVYEERAATEVASTKREARKRKAADADEHLKHKQGLNRLDIIESAIAEIIQKLNESSIAPKHNTISTCRRKLLEFVFRQAPMDVRIVTSKTDKVKTIKTLEDAVQHFKQVVFDLHAQELGVHGLFDDVLGKPDSDDRDSEQTEETGHAAPAFTLSVSADMIRDMIRDMAIGKWIIRPFEGTNMTRRLAVGAFVELKNNKHRACVRVERIERSEKPDDLIAKISKHGAKPGDIAPKAKSTDDALTWLNQFGSKQLVAFKVALPADDDCDANTDVTDATSGGVRSFRKRPSETVDVGTLQIKQKFKELQAHVKKHGPEDVLSWDVFAKAAVDMMKGGKRAPLDAVTHAVTATLCALPREFDYIIQYGSNSSVKNQIDIATLRAEFSSCLAPMAVAPAYHAVIASAFELFTATLEEYEFPKYNIDVESFANDLLQAAMRGQIESQDEQTTAKATLLQEHAREVLSLKEELAKAKAALASPSETNSQNEDTIGREAASSQSLAGGTNAPESGSPERSYALVASEYAAAVTGDDVVGAAEGEGKADKDVHCYNRFALVRGDASVLARKDFSTTVAMPLPGLLEVLVPSALDAWVSTLRAGIDAQLQVANDGCYEAKVDIPIGGLVIPFTGKLCSATVSKFRVRCNGAWLDGTQRQREFPNAWRGILYLGLADKVVGAPAQPNMVIEALSAPILAFKLVDHDSDFVFLKPFDTPVAKN